MPDFPFAEIVPRGMVTASDVIAAAVIAALGAVSLFTWSIIFVVWIQRGAVLLSAPRRPVPWGPAGSLLALAAVLLAVLAAFQPEPTPGDGTALRAASVLLQIIVVPLVVGGFLTALAVLSRATPRDLGLPHSARQFAADLALGAAACLAALLPVYVLMGAMFFLLGEPEPHPIVDLVLRNRSMAVLALAAVSAVLVAPICEEITFRLLLQGWLEKWLGARVALPGATAKAGVCDTKLTADEASNPDEISSPIVGEAGSENGPFLPAEATPFRYHGWLPIFASSALFALAHYGHGYAPLAIFVLAIVLGYVYQRTHRIVPCIAAHAAFNALTTLELWRRILFTTA
jgi:membrane protease YdiL (CAAX protease family)